MTLKLENTNTIAAIDGVPCRVWMGTNEKGVVVTAFITRIYVQENKADQFKKDLEIGLDTKVEVSKNFIV